MPSNKLKKFVSDVMTKDVVTMKASESVSKASRLMLDKRIHGIIVTENDKPKYVVSTFDILQVAYVDFLSDDQDFLTTPIESLVEGQKIISLKASDTLENALEIFTEHNIRTLPVADSNGNLIGVLSLMDVAKFLS